MKTTFLANIFFAIFGLIGSVNSFAQETNPTKETQEITIRKNGKKDTKVTIEITDNKIMVNGKPLAEFKEDGITINNRKMIIREGNKITMMLDEGGKTILENIEGSNFNFGETNIDDMITSSRTGRKKVMLGVMTDVKENEGVIINEVVKESAAELAGLLKDDIIYKVDDAKIESPKELADYIKTKKAADKIKIYFTRDGKKKDAIATLLSKNVMSEVRVFKDRHCDNCPEVEMQNGKANINVFRYNNDENDNYADDLGTNIEENINRRFGMPSTPKLGLKIQDTEEETGVKVINVEPASSSASAGLQKDDIIVGIGEKTIKNTDEARAALNENKGKSSYAMKVKRNGADVNLTIKIPKKLKTANL